jgi:tetratricopeptide (TPR) repeat protein
MAKRKRKSSGGGAFGKSGSKRLSPTVSEFEEDEGLEIFRDRIGADHERRAATMSRNFRSLVGKSAEDMDVFSKALFELSLEDFLERYDPEPEAHFRAIKHLEDRGDEDSEESIRARVAEALAIDPDCVDAHLLLADLSADPEVIIGHVSDAITAGRRKREAMLEAAGDGLPDAALEVIDRPYLEALHELANYQWLKGDREASRETCEILLAADPDDLRDITPTLIALGILRGDFEEASSLIDSALMPGSTSVRYSRALLAFLHAMEEFPDFEPEMSSPEPFGQVQSPKMREARALLRSAIEASPWAIPFILDPRVLLLRPTLVYTLGDPFDAIEFARLNYVNWTVQVLPSLWLVSEFGRGGISAGIERRLRHRPPVFLEALELLDEIEPPGLDDPEVNPFLGQFFQIAGEISEMMVERGESPKGRRFRR